MKILPRLVFPLSLTLLASMALGQNQGVGFAQNFFDDPEFKKKFEGTYAPVTEVEPPINEDEGTLLTEILGYMRNNELRVAATTLEGRIQPESSARLYFLLGNLYFQLDDFAKAVRNYEKALDKFPDYRRALLNIALIQIQQQAFDKAINNLSRAVELGENTARSFGLLGYLYLQKRSPLPASSAYRQAILLDPQNKDWKEGLAQSLMSMRNYSEALSMFEQLLAEEPGNVNYWNGIVNTYLNLDQELEAAKVLEMMRLAGLAGQDNLRTLGDIYLTNEMFGAALDTFKTLIQAEGEPPAGVLIRAARNLTRFSAWEEANELVSTVRGAENLNLKKDERLELLTLEALIATNQGRTGEAAKIFHEIVEVSPSNGEAQLELGKYYAAQEEYGKATYHFQMAQEIRETEFRAFLENAQMLVRQQRFAEAIPLLRQATQVKESQAVEQYLRRIERAAKIQESQEGS